MLNRRDLLRLGVASFGLSAVPFATGARAQVPSSARRHRYMVIINMTGGMDSVYTTDPKLKKAVEPWVDVPFSANDIVDTGKVVLGPHFAPLARQRRLAVLNGIQLGTANHDTGLDQFVRLRTQVKKSMPNLLDIFGAHRTGQPLSSVTLGYVSQEYYSSNFFGLLGGSIPKGKEGYPEVDIFSAIEQNTEDEDCVLLASHLRRAATKVKSRGGMAAHTTSDRMEQAASLLARLTKLPTFAPATWSNDDAAQEIAVQLQRLLWVLENDLASGVQVGIGQQWDTHWANDKLQATANAAFVPMFARFVQELEKRSNEHGNLFDSTLVVVGSEIGRFPRLNSNLGKDHLSQAPFLFLGGGVLAGQNDAKVFGQTDRRMLGLPLSLRSGKHTKLGGHLPTLDDVGATVLHMAGIEPAIYGYNGNVLHFLYEG